MTTVPATYSRIVVPRTGDASVLALETAADTATTLPLLGDDLLVRVAFAGVNFIDTYFRSGLYKKPSLPFSPGQEGSGVVIAAGPQVAGGAAAWVGKHVAFYNCDTGSYSQLARVHRRDAFIVPDGFDLKSAAALLLQGGTAHYLTHDTYPTKPSDVVLVHAAAGGTGLLITQMAKKRGATVIGVCGGPEKAKLAKEVGKCDFVVDYKAPDTADWEKEVLRLTDGKKCTVVYDGVGKSTFDRSLHCLRTRGMMVSFGNASGAVEPVAPLDLCGYGSLSLCRPKMGDYMLTDEERTARVNDIVKMVNDGDIQLTINTVIPFEEAAKAHALLEGQQTVGKILIQIPPL